MTPQELEALLAKIVDFREALRLQWATVMRFDDEPIPPELAAVRSAIVADNDWAEGAEQRVRRAIVRRWAGDSLDAGLVDLIARYRVDEGRN